MGSWGREWGDGAPRVKCPLAPLPPSLFQPGLESLGQGGLNLLGDGGYGLGGINADNAIGVDFGQFGEALLHPLMEGEVGLLDAIAGSPLAGAGQACCGIQIQPEGEVTGQAIGGNLVQLGNQGSG